MTWAEFNVLVREYLTVNNSRLGIQKFVDRHIKTAVRDIQHFAPLYRQGHKSVFQADDLTRHGQASVGTIPDDAFPLTMEVQKVSERCRAQPVLQWPVEHVRELICGNPTVGRGCRFWLSFDDQAKRFTCFPKIDEGYQLVFAWDGIKDDFSDDDIVPFDNDVAYAVAEWVLWKLAPDIDKTPGSAATHQLSYVTERRKVVRNARNRVTLRHDTEPPNEALMGGCANDCSTTAECSTVGNSNSCDGQLEVMLLGNSGDTSTASKAEKTEAVASLVNRNDPDLLIHLGNLNYPSGSGITIQDNFSKWYYGWLSKMYAAFGDVDDLTDSGDPVFTVLTHLAGLNDAKRYYRFVSGEAEFFVMHWQSEPDGLAFDSTQGAWLQAALADSTAAWKIVIAHAAPWTSDSVNTPGNATLRYPFKDWGAHLLITAGGLVYERGVDPDTFFPWITAGLGGAPKGGFGTFVNGSQYRYNTQYGALRLAISLGRLEASFITDEDEIIDRLVLKNGLEDEDADSSCASTPVSVTPTTPCVICLDGSSPSKTVVRPTVDAMRSVTTYGEDFYFVTLGGTTKNDGFGKRWYYEPTSMDVDDGTGETVVIRPSVIPLTSPGRLIQTL